MIIASRSCADPLFSVRLFIYGLGSWVHQERWRELPLELLSQTLLGLPVAPDLDSSDIERIARAVLDGVQD
jgi:hypothetical protein